MEMEKYQCPLHQTNTNRSTVNYIFTKCIFFPQLLAKCEFCPSIYLCKLHCSTVNTILFRQTWFPTGWFVSCHISSWEHTSDRRKIEMYLDGVHEITASWINMAMQPPLHHLASTSGQNQVLPNHLHQMLNLPSIRSSHLKIIEGWKVHLSLSFIYCKCWLFYQWIWSIFFYLPCVNMERTVHWQY